MTTQQQKAEALAANPKYSKVSRVRLGGDVHPSSEILPYTGGLVVLPGCHAFVVYTDTRSQCWYIWICGAGFGQKHWSAGGYQVHRARRQGVFWQMQQAWNQSNAAEQAHGCAMLQQYRVQPVATCNFQSTP